MQENRKDQKNQNGDELDRLFELRVQQIPAPGEVFQQTLDALRPVQAGINSNISLTKELALNPIPMEVDEPFEMLTVATSPDYRPTITSGLSPVSMVGRASKLVTRRTYNNLPFALVAGLVLAVTAAVLLLLIVAVQGNNQAVSNPSPVAAATIANLSPTPASDKKMPSPQPAGGADYLPNTDFKFLYPGATKFIIPNAINTGGFATAADWQIVTAYYKQKLPTYGYTVFKDDRACPKNDCDQFMAGNGKFLVSINIYSLESWQTLAPNLDQADKVTEQLKQISSVQTVAGYSFQNGPLPASVTPNATPLTTALPTVTPAPVANLGVDLSYPDADTLQLDREYLLAGGATDEVKNAALGAYGVADDYTKIQQYYRQKLIAAGYNVAITNQTIGTVCGLGCDAAVVEATTIDGSLIKVVVFNPTSIDQLRRGQGNLGQTMLKLSAQLKPGQTLIIYEATVNSSSYKATVATGHTAIAAFTPASAATLFGPVIYNPGTVTPMPATVTPGPGATASPTSPFGEPTPRFTPTPLAPNSLAFLGPDNQTHPDKAGGLVATDDSLKIGAQQNSNYYLNGLVSDAVNGTHLDWTIEYEAGSSFSFSPNEAGTLTDEAGHSYPLSIKPDRDSLAESRNLNNKNKDGKPFTYTGFRLSGPALPPGTRTVIFTPGDGMPFKLATPVTLHLKTFQEAALPQLKPLTGAVANVGGVKVALPYAYFGRDHTWLEVIVDTTGFGKKFLDTGGNYYIPNDIILNDTSQHTPASTPGPATGPGYATPSAPLNIAKSSLLDDKGQPLAALGSYPGANGIRLAVNQTFDQNLVLKPLTADAKSITLNIPSLNVLVSWDELHYVRVSAAAPRFTLPLAEIIRSSKILPGGTISLPGFVVQIIGVQAVLNQVKGEVTLTIKHQTLTTGPTGQGSVSNASVSLVCGKCDPNTTSQTRNSTPNTAIIEDNLTFKYDPAQTSLELDLSGLGYTLNGPWLVTIPVSQS